ncbi:MAG: phosphoketolase family protein [Actinomycetota bacterium]|nr:phosphoketolase family protein [Actinomycetota bacterium]
MADLALLDRFWSAANYLTVGQIYLRRNPLLRVPLEVDDVKPRLLGHWGTSPGLNLVYVHLNRLIRENGTNVLFVAGPGHGGPAVLANVYLEGTYSEVYPTITADTRGMELFFRQFSTPGGVPSHVSVPTPGSIHEGGELGYALVHAVGAAFDNPDLLVACIVGDGEAETGPLAASWNSVHFLNPARDGAVLPILHLNGYKIGGPTVFGRTDDADLTKFFEGSGYAPRFVESSDPMTVHEAFAATLDDCHASILEIQRDARDARAVTRPRWPMIVLRTPKGWTGPRTVDGQQVEGTFRAHQVPVARVREDPAHLAILEEWMRSYRPETLFDEHGTLIPELQELVPARDLRMGASPHANGGTVLQSLDLPPCHDYALDVSRPAVQYAESTRRLGELLRDVFVRNADARNFRIMSPDEIRSNRLDAVFDVENRCLMDPILPTDDHESPFGRVMEVLSEHLCEGWLEGYLLTGRHGLFATYEAFAMVAASMTVQHAKWLEAATALSWRAPIASLNVLLTSTCWRNDHNGFSHQGPGLIDTILSKRGTVARVYLPPDANCLLSVADHCLKSRNYVNLIVIDKQPQLQYLDMTAAHDHCSRGASIWDWAGNVDDGGDPDIVLACAGDTPTMETVAAACILRRFVPDLRVRVINVVDLMTLFPRDVHPHGFPAVDFVELFTADTDVVFAFHGYPRALHELLHGRPSPDRFHVHGYREQGTTTTPFDMVVLNETSRYHLATEAVHRSRRLPRGAPQLIEHCAQMLDRHHAYIVEHLEDMPEVRDWTWSEP